MRKIESLAVVSSVAGMEIVFEIDLTVKVVPAVKVSIVEKVIALPIAVVEKLSEGIPPLMDIPKPKGVVPGKVVEAEKSMTYTPSSRIVSVSMPLKFMLFMFEAILNWMF